MGALSDTQCTLQLLFSFFAIASILTWYYAKITDALRRYGVSDTSTSLFAIRVGPASTEDISESSVLSQMEAVVNGGLKPLDALVEITDWAAIRKVSIINSDTWYPKEKRTDNSTCFVMTMLESQTQLRTARQCSCKMA